MVNLRAFQNTDGLPVHELVRCVHDGDIDVFFIGEIPAGQWIIRLHSGPNDEPPYIGVCFASLVDSNQKVVDYLEDGESSRFYRLHSDGPSGLTQESVDWLVNAFNADELARIEGI